MRGLEARMEDGWEPRHESPGLDASCVERMVRQFARARPFRIRGPLAGGLANFNVRVSLADPAQDVVLRVYVRDPAVAGKEAALLERLADSLPVPRLLHRGTDDDASDGNAFPYIVTSWVPGIALTDLLRDGGEHAHRVAGERIGRVLATLHARSYLRMGFLDAALDVIEPFGTLQATFAEYVRAAVRDGHAGRRLGRTTSGRVLRFVDRKGPRLESLEGDYALLHADCKPTNVRVTPAGELTGLLDWEFAWAGPPLFDLGQMLRWPVPPAFEDALAHAYAQAGGRMPGDWRFLARLLDVLNLIGFLDDAVERPVTHRDAKTLLEATLAAS